MKKAILVVCKTLAAIVLLQTLYFKFTGSVESKFIFSTLGAEPWGRLFSGVMELLTSILLFVPKVQVLGALLGMGIMFGAIVSHIFVLGIVVQNDGGLLFCLAWIVFVCCAVILFFDREKIFSLIKKFQPHSKT